MKTLHGIVKSLAAAHTASVEVAHLWRHPLYKKSVKRTKRYACETGSLELVLGDAVEIQPCKPVSKTKKFKVVAKAAAK